MVGHEVESQNIKLNALNKNGQAVKL